MWIYLLQRLLHGVPILLGVSLVVFLLARIAPGDPIDLLLPPEAPQAVIDRLRSEYGFDRPLYIQYFAWLGKTITGDLGLSVFTGFKVSDQLFSALGNTFLIAVPAAFLGFSLGILFGALAAFHHRRALDKLFSAVAITGVSLPHYWVGIVLVIVFSVILNWLPAMGMGSGGIPTTWEQFRHFILPVITVSLIPMGMVSRMARATLLEVLNQEFVTALRAKGLLPLQVLGHVMKNAAPPILAVTGLQFGYLLGGSILAELVFNWPGSGQLMSLAILRRDLPVLQATIVVLASFFVLINLVVDLLQAAIDPRIRR